MTMHRPARTVTGHDPSQPQPKGAKQRMPFFQSFLQERHIDLSLSQE
jgi:hypothetical protein